MIKKTEGEKVEQAVREILLEGLLNADEIDNPKVIVNDKTKMAAFDAALKNINNSKGVTKMVRTAQTKVRCKRKWRNPKFQ